VSVDGFVHEARKKDESIGWDVGVKQRRCVGDEPMVNVLKRAGLMSYECGAVAIVRV
jgi:hypothetical protein